MCNFLILIVFVFEGLNVGFEVITSPFPVSLESNHEKSQQAKYGNESYLLHGNVSGSCHWINLCASLDKPGLFSSNYASIFDKYTPCVIVQYLLKFNIQFLLSEIRRDDLFYASPFQGKQYLNCNLIYKTLHM